MKAHALVPLLFVLGLGCHSLDDRGVFALEEPGEVAPRLRYADGQVSLNRTCLIRLANPLNPRMPPAYVNGRPLGFC